MRAPFAAVALAATLLAGCSSVVDPDPPAPLPVMEGELPLRMLWRTQIGSGADEQRVTLQPVVADDLLYVADHRGLLAAISLGDGRRLWERDTELTITGGVGFGDGRLLVGTLNGEVVVFNSADGSEQWRRSVSSEVLSPPQIASGIVLAHSVDGKLFGLDAGSGERKWFYQQRVPALTLRGTGTPVADSGRVYTGFASGKLVAIELNSGRVLWETTVTVPRGRTELERMVDIDARPVLDRDTLYVTAYQGRVAAVAASTGVLIWARDISAYQPVGLARDRLFVSDDRGHVWALARDNGVAIWKQEQLQARGLTAPVAYGDYVVVGDFEGYLHFLDRSDGRILGRVQIDSEGLLEAPIVVDDILYVYSKGGALVALTQQKAS